MTVIGEIPTDIDGVYLRNTENQIPRTHRAVPPLRRGRHDPYDELCRRQGGVPQSFGAYQGLSRGTAGGPFALGGAHGTPLAVRAAGMGRSRGVEGCLVNGRHRARRDGAFDVLSMRRGLSPRSPHAGRSRHRAVGARRRDIGASEARRKHTGELLFFNYSKHAPYMHYGVVGADNRLKHYMPVPLPGPRLPHDMAVHRKLCHRQRSAALLGMPTD